MNTQVRNNILRDVKMINDQGYRLSVDLINRQVIIHDLNNAKIIGIINHTNCELINNYIAVINYSFIRWGLELTMDQIAHHIMRYHFNDLMN